MTPKTDPFSKAKKTAEAAELLPFAKTPPYSAEAEQGVLGCILLDAQSCIGECIEKIKPGSAAFHDVRNRTVYEVLLEMNDRREAVDVITVMNRLRDKQQLEQVGGIAYLAELPDKVPSAANIQFYISILLEKHILRRAIEHAQNTIVKAYEAESSDAFLNEFESGAMAVRNSIATNRESDIKKQVQDRLSFYEQCYANGGGLIGIPTGFKDIDHLTAGMQKAQVIIVAGRPSAGKTSLAMNIAENVAVDQRLPVGVFSLETSTESLVGRMITCRAKVNERMITSARITERDFPKLGAAAAAISASPLYIDDTGGITIDQLSAKARRWKKDNGIVLLVIDYIQLVRHPKYIGQPMQETSEVSKCVKALAKELDIPIIAIAQLNREVDKGAERKPRMSDLRESGQLEQDADVLFLLYLADPAKAAMEPNVVQVNALLGKQKNGPRDIDIPLTFFREFTRFESCSPIREEDSEWKK